MKCTRFSPEMRGGSIGWTETGREGVRVTPAWAKDRREDQRNDIDKEGQSILQ